MSNLESRGKQKKRKAGRLGTSQTYHRGTRPHVVLYKYWWQKFLLLKPNLIVRISLTRTVDREVYPLLTSCIVPRPIALVSSISSDGIPNLAPFRGVFFQHILVNQSDLTLSSSYFSMVRLTSSVNALKLICL